MPSKVFIGNGPLANPRDAHVGYEQDDRVVAMITRGIGNPGTHQR